MLGAIPIFLANLELTTLIGAPVSTIARILILSTQMSTYVQSNLASIFAIDKILEGSRLLIKEVIAPYNLGQQDLMVESGRETETDLTYATEVKVQRWCPGLGLSAVLHKVLRQFLEHDWNPPAL